MISRDPTDFLISASKIIADDSGISISMVFIWVLHDESAINIAGQEQIMPTFCYTAWTAADNCHTAVIDCADRVALTCCIFERQLFISGPCHFYPVVIAFIACKSIKEIYIRTVVGPITMRF